MDREEGSSDFEGKDEEYDRILSISYHSESDIEGDVIDLMEESEREEEGEEYWNTSDEEFINNDSLEESEEQETDFQRQKYEKYHSTDSISDEEKKENKKEKGKKKSKQSKSSHNFEQSVQSILFFYINSKF